MNRTHLLTGHIRKDQRGIEIGPWCHPLLPKREGYAVTILDVYPTEILRQRALADPELPPACVKAIEEVDLVGSACDIADLVAAAGIPGDFDYIVASHAFEHLPDPVRFLQGCEHILRPGGRLSLAIPDKRGCFDYFRPVSSLAEMLAAYFEGRRQPTLAQVFERWSMHACWRHDNGQEQISFPVGVPAAQIEPYDSLVWAYQAWKQALAQKELPYQDTHCWVLTPANFSLILFDLQTLGLCQLVLKSLTPCDGEFIVHLEKPYTNGSVEPATDRLAKRRELLHAALREAGAVVEANPVGPATKPARPHRFGVGLRLLQRLRSRFTPDAG